MLVQTLDWEESHDEEKLYGRLNWGSSLLGAPRVGSETVIDQTVERRVVEGSKSISAEYQ